MNKHIFPEPTRPRQGERFTANVEMLMTDCPVCGCPFAMPATLADWNRTNRDVINLSCPKGHRLEMKRPKVLKDIEEVRAENRRLKGQLARALHAAEQATGGSNEKA